MCRCPASSDSIRYSHRRWRDADLYFFFNESTEKQSRRAVVMGNGNVQVWDALSGHINTLSDAVVENGTVRFSLELKPYGT
jgi:hypothetical protein